MELSDRVPLGYWRSGRPIYLAMGGAPDPDPAAPPAADPPKPPDPPKPADPPEEPDLGFPANTRIADMTVEQEKNYWKHQSRKHEGRNAAYGGKTPEQIATDQARLAQLEYDLAGEKGQAVIDAKKEASDAAYAAVRPLLVAANLETEAVRAGVSEDDLNAALQFADSSKFLTADGQVDAAKVKTFVGTIAPAKGKQQQPRGPIVTVHGQGNGATQLGEQGRAMAAKRFGTKP